MYCPSCGKQIPEGSAFCLHCGKPIPTLTADAPAAPVTAARSSQLHPSVPGAQQKSPISEGTINKIKELLSKGSKVLAVQLYREETGVGLKEAKDFVDGIEAGLPTTHTTAVPAPRPVAPQPPIGTGIHRGEPAATQQTDRSATLDTSGAASRQPPSTAGEYIYTDWVLEFPPALQKRLAMALSGRGALSVEEVRQRFWSAYQGAIDKLIQDWKDQGWQPVASLGPSCLEMRIVKDYRDKNLLYWILMIIAVPVTAGISLLIALLPRPFAEPTRYVVKMRAPSGTRIPPMPVMPAS